MCFIQWFRIKILFADEANNSPILLFPHWPPDGLCQLCGRSRGRIGKWGRKRKRIFGTRHGHDDLIIGTLDGQIDELTEDHRKFIVYNKTLIVIIVLEHDYFIIFSLWYIKNYFGPLVPKYQSFSKTHSFKSNFEISHSSLLAFTVWCSKNDSNKYFIFSLHL